jgi:stalled ribosome rescue protein Dom34
VLVNEHLSSPPPTTVVRLSEYPYFMPLVEFGEQRPPYLFAAVDHLGADITIHEGDTMSTDAVDGGGYPVHKPATAGWNGYGDQQHSAEEAIRMNVRAVADRITELVDRAGAELVFVSGEVRSRTDVCAALPERVRERVIQLHAGARGHRGREEEVSDRIDEAFRQSRQSAATDVATRFTSEMKRHSGFAAEGLEAVCAELREGAVETLIVTDLGDETVVTGEKRTTIAPDADALSELGEAPQRVVRADEALPLAAICISAALIRVDGIQPADGVAALLRYVPSD